VFAIALVVNALLVVAQPPSGSFHEAERLARQGHHDEALRRFEEIAVAQPTEIDARVWIARLQYWLGRTDQAERTFRDVLDESPDHVEALIGLGTVLAARGRLSEALIVLDRARGLASENADVLAALGHVSRLGGRMALAETYYAWAVALSPKDPDIRLGLEQTRRLHRHRVEATVQHESYNEPRMRAPIVDVSVDVRAADRARILGRLQTQDKFSRTEMRGGGGAEWRARPDATLRGWVVFGPGAEVLPRADASGELEYFHNRTELGAGMRYAKFATASVWVVTPSVSYWINERTVGTVRYYKSMTRYGVGGTLVGNHSGLLRLQFRVTSRAWIDVAHARGNESFETLSADRLGRFQAQTWSAGVRTDLPGLTSFGTSVEYQRRNRLRTMVRVAATVSRRF
jgi:YaiO family outer membrane protein